MQVTGNGTGFLDFNQSISDIIQKFATLGASLTMIGVECPREMKIDLSKDS